MRLELIDIHKYFGSVHANDGITMTIEPGLIYGILGENGAGKSTLMKILAGLIRKSSGTIRIDGRSVDFNKPADASARGIGMLYQEPLDFPALTVLDNFMIGRTSGMTMKTPGFMEAFSDACRRFGFQLDPHRPLGRLTLGERQQLEMLRLIAGGVRLLILDEPTTGISGEQKEMLFRALRRLVSEGRSIVLVSHKLEDVETLCDRITVLRKGRVTGTVQRPFDTDNLLSLMFGKPPDIPQRILLEPGPVVLEMEDVSAPGGRTGLTHCSARVRRREIVGLAGLEGSGQGIFLRVAAGLIRPAAGSIRFDRQTMQGMPYHEFRRRGICFLPASRMEEGLIAGLSLSDHFEIIENRRFRLQRKKADDAASRRIESFRIKGTPGTVVEALSGGNQQKLLLSFLPEQAALLLLENPTRGLDVESAHWIWRHLQKRCAGDTAIVFSSSELDEIFQVADRIIVFFDGRIVLDAPVTAVDRDTVGAAIAGKKTAEGVAS